MNNTANAKHYVQTKVNNSVAMYTI